MSEDLFSASANLTDQPLAYRMRPRTLDEYIGQEHIIGKGRLLRRAIAADLLSSVIFYGPPGTGKTTLARVIANTTKSHFSTLNAVLSGVKELRYEIDAAKTRLDHYGTKTILFVDEVHRWNKSQQDALLPWVENGTIILIGATTENPYFEVNAALVSRSRVFQLTKLSEAELRRVALQAIGDKERGYGNYKIFFEEGALEHLVKVAAGDARSLLNALQLAVETTPETFPPKANEVIRITMEVAEESIQKKVVLYDKEGDYHFDVISAFIKSIRGSDPDAALYWMARMVAAGEEPRFIFRRMLISAAEDIGMADPQAIAVVEADAAAFDRIGLPEGRYHLTHAALYLATCPKSNSAMAFFDALSDVEKEKQDEVPNHLKDANRDGKSFGHGEGYLYPHAYRDHWVAQQYLPSSLQGKVYYKPTDQGYEKTIKEEVERKREAQLESVTPDAFVENLTYSPTDKKLEMWLKRTSSQGSQLLLEVRDRLFQGANIKRSDNILILNASHGLLLWEAMRKNPEGLCTAQVKTEEEKEYINHYASTLEALRRPEVLSGQVINVLHELDEELRYEFIIGRNLFSRLKSETNLLNELVRHLSLSGEARFAESVPSKCSPLSQFMVDKGAKKALENAEEVIFHDKANPMVNWDEDDMYEFFNARFENTHVESLVQTEVRVLDEALLRSWYERTYRPILAKQGNESGLLLDKILKELSNKRVNWRHYILIAKLSHETLKETKPNPSKVLWDEVEAKTKKKF